MKKKEDSFSRRPRGLDVYINERGFIFDLFSFLLVIVFGFLMLRRPVCRNQTGDGFACV